MHYTFRETDDSECYDVLVNGISVLSIPKSFGGYERALGLAQTLVFIAQDIEEQLKPSENGEMLYNMNILHTGVELEQMPLPAGPDPLPELAGFPVPDESFAGINLD